MKILTKKQVNEILKRITANEIICIDYLKDIDAHTHLIENNADIAYLVGGIEGMNKIQNMLKERYQPKESEKHDKLAGKNNYKETYNCFYEIAKIIQDKY